MKEWQFKDTKFLFNSINLIKCSLPVIPISLDEVWQVMDTQMIVTFRSKYVFLAWVKFFNFRKKKCEEEEKKKHWIGL